MRFHHSVIDSIDHKTSYDGSLQAMIIIASFICSIFYPSAMAVYLPLHRRQQLNLLQEMIMHQSNSISHLYVWNHIHMIP